MDRPEMLELWNDMWKEGNWVPSWPDSLGGMTAKEASWSPDAVTHSIWQEVAHTIFWRRVTLCKIDDDETPSDEEVEGLQFAVPENPTDEAWSTTLHDLEQTQKAIAEAIQDGSKDV